MGLKGFQPRHVVSNGAKILILFTLGSLAVLENSLDTFFDVEPIVRPPKIISDEGPTWDAALADGGKKTLDTATLGRQATAQPDMNRLKAAALAPIFGGFSIVARAQVPLELVSEDFAEPTHRRGVDQNVSRGNLVPLGDPASVYPSAMMNRWYVGDNLNLLKTMADNTFTLVYLDPPYNTNKKFNAPLGENMAHELAYDDTWVFNEKSWEDFHVLKTEAPKVHNLLMPLYEASSVKKTVAYLLMMAPRLIEMHRVLNARGSLFLHCDPTASHYLKVLLDLIFGESNFRSEIIWRRSNAHSNTKSLGPVHDTILYYTKTDQFVWNPIHLPFDSEYVSAHYKYEDEDGRRYRRDNLTAASGGGRYEWRGKKPYSNRYWTHSFEQMEELERQGRILYNGKGFPEYKRYLDEQKGVLLQDIWTDIKPVKGKKSVNFPGQKPVELLDRIIRLTTNEKDTVLDPFLGSGTTAVAAEQADRYWVGIELQATTLDIAHNRLATEAGIDSREVPTHESPTDLEGAKRLALRDKDEFERWVIEDLLGGHKTPKGRDGGVDGRLHLEGFEDRKHRLCVVDATGSLTPQIIRDKVDKMGRKTLDLHNATAGIVVAFGEVIPKSLRTLAGQFGYYTSEIPHDERRYPRVMVVSVEELQARGTDVLRVPGFVKRIAPTETLAGQERHARELFDIMMDLTEEGATAAKE